MENAFIVSARKYRPQTFDIVVGQSHITTTLINAILQGQLAHAYLFCGPRGVGKTTCARILAKAINCENLQQNAQPCNKCNPCLSFQSGSSFHVFELDAASNNSVENIRHLIEQVRYAPQGGKYKVFIVDEVHMLSTGAFNAFLKTLEEPPPYAIFILATTEKYKILPTILSRCQIYDFKRISNHDIEDYLNTIALQESIQIEKEALSIIAQKSEGGMRDALSIFDKLSSFTKGNITYLNTIEHLNVLDTAYFFKLFSSIQNQNIAQVLTLFNEIYNKGFEGDIFLNAIAEFLRELLVCKNPESQVLLNVLENFKKQYIALSETLSLSFILSSINILNDAEIQYKNTRNKKLLIETALIKITFLNNAIELVQESDTLQSKKKISYKQILKYSPILIKNHPAIVNTINVEKVQTQLTPTNTVNISTIKSKEPSVISKVPQEKKIKNLNDILSQVNQNQYELAQRKKIILTNELIQNACQELIQELLEKNNGFTANIFQNIVFQITEKENHIKALVNSTFNKEGFKQHEFLFVDYMKKKFHLNSIFIEIELEQNANHLENQTPYLSAQELFQKLSEINPQLINLKNKLRLDIQY